jgi:signal transduction histidine kinase
MDQNTKRIDQLSRIVSVLIKEDVQHYDRVKLKVNLNEIRNRYREIDFLCLMLPDNTTIYAGSALAEERADNIARCHSSQSDIGIRSYLSQLDGGGKYSVHIKLRQGLYDLSEALSNPFVLVSSILFILLYLLGVRYLAEAAGRVRSEVIVNLSKQVAHDIRSPLSALNMISTSLTNIPEEKRLILRTATQRINDIANDLLQRGKVSASIEKRVIDKLLMPAAIVKPVSNLEPVMISAMLDSVVSEKRVQYGQRPEVDIHADLDRGYGLFAAIDSVALARVVSNLINNSVEALSGAGHIRLELSSTKDRMLISIIDSGCGIDENRLSLLGHKQESFGKVGRQSGFGLGLVHARQVVESAGGTLEIASTLKKGTTVRLNLPKASAPRWFVEEIRLQSGSVVVSVDDDLSIHQIWSDRLASASIDSTDIKHLTFSSIKKFEEWVEVEKYHVDLFLIDYEFLGQRSHGLNLIFQAGIEKKAILVTSRYEDTAVRGNAHDMGVRILPKALAPLIPIHIDRIRLELVTIVIDDDSLVHLTWNMAANGAEKKVCCYFDGDSFLQVSEKFDRKSPVFIDVHLGGGERGEDLAVKISAMGFKHIFLATGESPEAITAPDCVKQVIGKDPDFSHST